ncbi:MAG: glycosyltransferase family 9 protein [bacterium]|nr:glycosyltransferase family 9 protein [bacterium]
MKKVLQLPARMIVDLPNWVGDQIMALPTLSRIVEANEGTETVFFCRPPVHSLLQGVFPAVEVIAAPRRAPLLRAVRELTRHRERFDIGITMRHAIRAKVMLRLIARRTVGSEGGGAELLLDHRFAVDRVHHQVHDSESVVHLFGLKPIDPAWRPQMPEALLLKGALVLRDSGVSGENAVGLAASAAWGDSKKWPAGRFGQLAQSLQADGVKAVVLVGPGEEDVGEAVCRSAGFEMPVLGASVDIAGLAGIMTGLAAVVGNDSGPMHVASLSGVPVIGLFGPTNPMRTGPLWGSRTQVSLELECAPCLEPRCPLVHNACLHELSVEQVKRAVLEAMQTAVAV